MGGVGGAAGDAGEMAACLALAGGAHWADDGVGGARRGEAGDGEEDYGGRRGGKVEGVAFFGHCWEGMCGGEEEGLRRCAEREMMSGRRRVKTMRGRKSR